MAGRLTVFALSAPHSFFDAEKMEKTVLFGLKWYKKERRRKWNKVLEAPKFGVFCNIK